jgi:hypothetical protein
MAQTTSVRYPILDRLRGGELTLLVERGGRLIFASDRPGIKSLYRAVHEHLELFEGSDVADKVVGIAAAYLLVYARVGRVYAQVCGKDAQRVLKEAGIQVETESLVKQIDDDPREPYPMEALAREAGGPARFVEELRARFTP